jgi:hypothetical protein
MNTYEIKIAETNVWIIKVEADCALTARNAAEEQIIEDQHMGQFVEHHIAIQEIAKL